MVHWPAWVCCYIWYIPSQAHIWYTKSNNTPMKGQCTNFILSVLWHKYFHWNAVKYCCCSSFVWTVIFTAFQRVRLAHTVHYGNNNNIIINCNSNNTVTYITQISISISTYSLFFLVAAAMAFHHSSLLAVLSGHCVFIILHWHKKLQPAQRPLCKIQDSNALRLVD